MKARSLASWVLGAAILASCDPVHEAQKDALGGETPGVRNGPLHRPGQPCIVCHDGALGDPPAFSIAGTIFADGNDTTPLPNAMVTITSVDGSTYALTTNAAGNFYAPAGDYTPKYPLHVSITSGSSTIKMTSHIGGNGSCAFCHADPAGPSSPGHVYFNVPNGIAP
jgi:hypothetical protein